MSATVADLLTAVMSLPSDSRMELVEAILERSSPTESFVSSQMEVVRGRMERIRLGMAQPIPASSAHEAVLERLILRA